MIRTTVGYAGGTEKNPEYRYLGDHSEAIRIEFDPRQVSYAELLDLFWENHDPTFQVWSRQYINAIFPLTEAQQKQAEQSRENLQHRLHRPVVTAIEPAGPFYPAEDYHQKYLLTKADAIYREFRAIYPDPKNFAASTAVARVNGYLGCNGDPDALEQEIGDLGLSPAMQQQLIDYVSTACSRFSGLTCPKPK